MGRLQGLAGRVAPGCGGFAGRDAGRDAVFFRLANGMARGERGVRGWQFALRRLALVSRPPAARLDVVRWEVPKGHAHGPSPAMITRGSTGQSHFRMAPAG